MFSEKVTKLLGQSEFESYLKSILAGFKDSKDFHNTFTVKTENGK